MVVPASNAVTDEQVSVDGAKRAQSVYGRGDSSLVPTIDRVTPVYSAGVVGKIGHRMWIREAQYNGVVPALRTDEFGLEIVCENRSFWILFRNIRWEGETLTDSSAVIIKFDRLNDEALVFGRNVNPKVKSIEDQCKRCALSSRQSARVYTSLRQKLCTNSSDRRGFVSFL